jgi:Arc/MetJ-type ribon-helix-helix transcriptional regulator
MNAMKRVQLDLPERSMARLLELRNRTEATSYAEVVKNALRLYEAVVEETEAGNKFFVKTLAGETTEYKIF